MPIAEIVNSTFKDIEIDSEFFNILLKSLAISYITKLAESICKDCNENAMSLLVQTSGKISISVLSIPMFLEIIRILTEVLK